MFTGIIHSTAKLKKINKFQNHFSFILESVIPVSKKDVGTSIAINGVCLTLIHFKKSQKCYDLQFDISPETLRVANLKKNKVGDLFNIEKSLKYGDEIAGHFVQGHVDDIGKVKTFSKIKNSWKIWIEIKPKFKKYLIKKGSITINGISLTINDIKKNMIRVDIIPHTFKKTNLKNIKINETVNIEYDLLMKFLKDNAK